MNKFDFKNRTAVITGGGQGFGLDIAKRFLNSPDYQPIKAIRLGASKSNAMLVEGF